MRDGPDIAALAALIGDPGRANMMTALMDGRALSAGELAQEGGVSLPTASGHLSRLVEAGLLQVERQGRHRYFRLSGSDVAEALEALMVLAEGRGRKRVRTGPRDAEMRLARSCYKHLAGELGVRMYDSLRAARAIEMGPEGLRLGDGGRAQLTALGLPDAVLRARAPVCRECLDWSERRMHLSGPLGTGLLSLILDKGWARRVPDSRVIRFSQAGRTAFDAAFPLREDVDVGD